MRKYKNACQKYSTYTYYCWAKSLLAFLFISCVIEHFMLKNRIIKHTLFVACTTPVDGTNPPIGGGATVDELVPSPNCPVVPPTR